MLSPYSAKVRSAGLYQLVEHADLLVGNVFLDDGPFRHQVTNRFGCFLISKVRVLLKKEPPSVLSIGDVNDPLESGPVEGPAKSDASCWYNLDVSRRTVQLLPRNSAWVSFETSAIAAYFALVEIAVPAFSTDITNSFSAGSSGS